MAKDLKQLKATAEIWSKSPSIFWNSEFLPTLGKAWNQPRLRMFQTLPHQSFPLIRRTWNHHCSCTYDSLMPLYTEDVPSQSPMLRNVVKQLHTNNTYLQRIYTHRLYNTHIHVYVRYISINFTVSYIVDNRLTHDVPQRTPTFIRCSTNFPTIRL